MKRKLLIVLSLGILLSLLGCSKDGNEKMNNDKTTSAETKVEKQEEPSTSVDLSKFDITKSEDEKSGVMFMPQNTNDSWELKFKKFRGTHTMSRIKLNKDQVVKFQYNSKIESGKLVFLILDNKGEIVKSVQGNKEEFIEVKAAEEGEYILKVVGEDATDGEIVVKFK